MELRLKKQPQKYLASVDANTREKLTRALEKLKELEGDIVCINPKKNLFRFTLLINVSPVRLPILRIP